MNTANNLQHWSVGLVRLQAGRGSRCDAQLSRASLSTSELNSPLLRPGGGLTSNGANSTVIKGPDGSERDPDRSKFWSLDWLVNQCRRDEAFHDGDRVPAVISEVKGRTAVRIIGRVPQTRLAMLGTSDGARVADRLGDNLGGWLVCATSRFR